MRIQTIDELADVLNSTSPKPLKLDGPELESIAKNIKAHKTKACVKQRTVYKPSPRLGDVQYAIRNLICHSSSACSYGSRLGALRCVQRHFGARYVARFDITKFFPSIHYSRVISEFERQHDLSPAVSRCLARLTTYDYHPAQGFRNSSAIADILLRTFDDRLENACKSRKITFTRYVDDIVLSANYDLKKKNIEKLIRKLLKLSGFRLNDKKTRYFNQYDWHALGFHVTKDGWNYDLKYWNGLQYAVAALKELQRSTNAKEFVDNMETAYDERVTPRKWDETVCAKLGEAAAYIRKKQGSRNLRERFLHEWSALSLAADRGHRPNVAVNKQDELAIKQLLKQVALLLNKSIDKEIEFIAKARSRRILFGF